MKYVVVLPQVGIPGEEWVAQPGISIEALIVGGFIRPVDEGNDATPDEPRRKVTRKERT